MLCVWVPLWVPTKKYLCCSHLLSRSPNQFLIVASLLVVTDNLWWRRRFLSSQNYHEIACLCLKDSLANLKMKIYLFPSNLEMLAARLGNVLRATPSGPFKITAIIKSTQNGFKIGQSFKCLSIETPQFTTYQRAR